MVTFIIGSIIILYALWAITFLVLWIANYRLLKIIATLEEAIDYTLLKTDLPETDPEKEKAIKTKMEIIKERIKKDFDV